MLKKPINRVGRERLGNRTAGRPVIKHPTYAEMTGSETPAVQKKEIKKRTIALVLVTAPTI